MTSERSCKTKLARRVSPRGKLVECWLKPPASFSSGPMAFAGLECESWKSIYRGWHSAIDFVKSGTQEDDVLEAHTSKRQASYQRGQVRYHR